MVHREVELDQAEEARAAPSTAPVVNEHMRDDHWCIGAVELDQAEEVQLPW